VTRLRDAPTPWRLPQRRMKRIADAADPLYKTLDDSQEAPSRCPDADGRPVRRRRLAAREFHARHGPRRRATGSCYDRDRYDRMADRAGIRRGAGRNGLRTAGP